MTVNFVSICRGMDGRVIAPRTRKEMAYVVALGGAPYVVHHIWSTTASVYL